MLSGGTCYLAGDELLVYPSEVVDTTRGKQLGALVCASRASVPCRVPLVDRLNAASEVLAVEESVGQDPAVGRECAGGFGRGAGETDNLRPKPKRSVAVEDVKRSRSRTKSDDMS